MTLPRKGTGRWGKPQEDDSGRETTEFVLVDDLATLMWLVNLAAVEFHTPMWRAGARGEPRSPDLLVFDLDPGPPAAIVECCRVACGLRERAGQDGIELLAKTSGSKGLQLYGTWRPRSGRPSETNEYAHALARELETERRRPRRVADGQELCERDGCSSTGARTTRPRRRCRPTRCGPSTVPRSPPR